MKSNEAIANFAAISAFNDAIQRNQGRDHAKSLAAHVWLSQQPHSDSREASSVIEELLADGTNCEV